MLACVGGGPGLMDFDFPMKEMLHCQAVSRVEDLFVAAFPDFPCGFLQRLIICSLNTFDLHDLDSQQICRRRSTIDT